MRTSRFELDTPNSGNRYAGQLAILTNKLQLFARALRQIGVYLLRLAVTPLRKIRWLFAARRIHQAAIRLTGRP